ncbi:hypothetical protein VKT23_008394 [Stygiomarasmius scandens]|uniref:Uncharacterized protein n=1 Tax=Marasmiellus scandens TaxID=2682957 RepID=A0ABR1JLE4_9AGAR
MYFWWLKTFIVVLSLTLIVNGRLFADVVSGDSATVSQCSEVQISFGGGTSPYSFDVWSYTDQEYVADTWTTDSAGTAIWSVQHSVDSVLYLIVTDSRGMYVQTHPFRVSSSSSCDSTIPEFQRTDQDAFSTATSPTAPAPTGITNSGADTPVPTELDDCGDRASCSFKPTSTGSTYPQQTLLGDAFDNCGKGNITVKETFSGSVTITNNWSVNIDGQFSLPELLKIDVSTSSGHSEGVTMTQSHEYNVTPGIRVALVGTATFDAVFGTVTVNYHINDSSSPVDAIYFQKDSQPPVVSLKVISCDESWPVWNATALSDDNVLPNGAIRAVDWVRFRKPMGIDLE